MEDAEPILEFLPASFSNRSEGDYIRFLWEAFASNYESDKSSKRRDVFQRQAGAGRTGDSGFGADGTLQSRMSPVLFDAFVEEYKADENAIHETSRLMAAIDDAIPAWPME